MQSEYTVSEFNQSVMVCVELKRGSLGVPISLSLATRDVTAQGNQILWTERQRTSMVETGFEKYIYNYIHACG